jgi:hypothetical protein
MTAPEVARIITRTTDARRRSFAIPSLGWVFFDRAEREGIRELGDHEAIDTDDRP